MSKEQILKALEIILDRQYREAGRGCAGCAPVRLTIGYTTKDNIVENGLVIEECPPTIVDNLIKENYTLSVHNKGLHVNHF